MKMSSKYLGWSSYEAAEVGDVWKLFSFRCNVWLHLGITEDADVSDVFVYTGQQVRSSSPGVVPTTWTEFGARVCSSTLGDNTWQRRLWTSRYLHDRCWLHTAWNSHRRHFQCQVFTRPCHAAAAAVDVVAFTGVTVRPSTSL